MSKWQEMYAQKKVSTEEAVQMINEGDMIVSGIGNGQPRVLCTALAQRVKEGKLKDIFYFNTLNINANALCAPEVAENITYRDAYATPLPRKLFAEQKAEYQCANFSDAVTILKIYDTIFCTVAPMDKHGYFSLGLNPDYIFGQVRDERPKRIFVEVNENYPRTYGHNHIHISEVHAVVENTWPLAAVPAVPPSETEMKIAAHIAELVEDGSCLQLGIGGLPNAVGKCLENKKDLGVHSEMVCDAFLHLYKKGAINNSKKNIFPLRGVGTFTFGSQELYDWVAENPGFEMLGADFVNDPRVIGQNDKMVAVNGIVEADLTGQCVSEEINGKTYSGLGGQQDFTLGAWFSKGGKALLAGWNSIDGGEAQTAVRLAEILDLPQATMVTEIKLLEGRASVKRDTEDGCETLEIELPALFTVQKGINEPRYPSFKGIMQAKKKPFQTVSADSMGMKTTPEAYKSKSEIVKLELPIRASCHMLEGSPEEVCRQLTQEVKAFL